MPEGPSRQTETTEALRNGGWTALSIFLNFIYFSCALPLALVFLALTGQTFDHMNWPLFHTWGLIHGSGSSRFLYVLYSQSYCFLLQGTVMSGGALSEALWFSGGSLTRGWNCRFLASIIDPADAEKPDAN
jgi:hypothetical protein